MIYRSAVFSRKSGLTAEEFKQHWINVHGVLAKDMPGLHSYRQNHIVERLYETSEPLDHDIDGISQLAFDDIAAMERSEVSPEYAAAKEDIRNFQGAITILVLVPKVVIEPPPKGDAMLRTKLLWMSVARGDESGAPLRDKWASESGEQFRKSGAFKGLIQNFVIDRAHPVFAGVPQGSLPVEAITEAWFGDASETKDWVASTEGKKLIHEDPLLKTIGVYVIEERTIV
ncbi:EthD family reductase [Burkholderia sp. SCN-KJ]|uniref:EthD family reductase n=1 Tax=Burkholderia sp. SCN-KJ TaxID=2969248 RepID=UPI00214FF6BA|nr:EthD family reductase [Burkholderia sp. SCN-KJ]MCR4470434.1 EthD family reductase [Burkholderia sp. SCN-KJ]